MYKTQFFYKLLISDKDIAVGLQSVTEGLIYKNNTSLDDKDTLFADFRPRGLYQAKSSMTK